ncbi:hypothetical protein BH11PSE12_BH11PSE12_20730 [soil metagenome]
MSDSSGSSTITWFLVVFGWVSTHFLTLRREKRKEVRSNLDIIKKQLAELEKDAVSFHTSTEHSAEKSRAILLKIQRIFKEIELESNIKKDTSSLRSKLRKSITLANFDKSAFATIGHDSDLLDKVSSAHDNLITQLECNYIKFYRDTYF